MSTEIAGAVFEYCGCQWGRSALTLITCGEETPCPECAVKLHATAKAWKERWDEIKRDWSENTFIGGGTVRAAIKFIEKRYPISGETETERSEQGGRDNGNDNDC